MNYGNITKANYQADIKRKQAFFNRCVRRFKLANTTGEKTFLKNEAKRICAELKTCSKNWKSFGFGGTTWITKNFNMVPFGKTTVSKSPARRPAARRMNKSRSSVRRTSTGSKARTGSRTRTNTTNRTFIAW